MSSLISPKVRFIRLFIVIYPEGTPMEEFIWDLSQRDSAEGMPAAFWKNLLFGALLLDLYDFINKHLI